MKENYTPVVSIIISNYNYACFLQEAIESAIKQTYQKTEIIVVDDGSNDGSQELTVKYRDRVTFVLKPNGGQASALNAGFALSRGKVVIFLDADDCLLEEAVATVVDLLAQEKVSKVHWPLSIVNESGQKTGELKPAVPLPDGNFRDKVLNAGPTSCLSAPTSGNAWSRHFLEQVMPIPENLAYYRRCADEYLYTLAPVFGEVCALKTPLGTYRMHGKNIYSAKSFQQKLEIELEGHVDQCRALGATLARHGITADIASWERQFWFRRLRDSIEEVRNVVQQHRFILVDDDTWGAAEIFENGAAVPFLEKEGRYWGPPETDEAAILELQRAHRLGSNYVVFAWPAFWWLDHYSGLNDYLRAHFHCRLENERVKVFDLQNRSSAHAAQSSSLESRV